MNKKPSEPDTEQAETHLLSRELSETELNRIDDLIRFIDANLHDIFKVHVDFHINIIVHEKGLGMGYPAFSISNVPDGKKAIWMLQNAIKAETLKLRPLPENGCFDA